MSHRADTPGWDAEDYARSSSTQLRWAEQLIAKKEGLKARPRTTWFPFTERLPEDSRDAFLADVFHVYVASHPINSHGQVHVRMVRFELEALALKSAASSAVEV